MENEFEVRGDITAIFLNSPKYGKMETLISTCKLHRANEFYGKWHPRYDKCIKSFYVCGHMPMVNGCQKLLYLHRWITNAPSNLVCDHINHDILNNTDENIRLITHAENMQNRKGAQRNSLSGIRGVFWRIKEKKWLVQVKGKYIGLFDNIEDAKIAAELAREMIMPFSKERIQA